MAKSVNFNDNHFEWQPEEFGFEPVDTRRLVFVFKEFELRRRPNNYWLLRRKLSKGSKKEILVKWYIKILPKDSMFAHTMFTKGLE